MPRQTIRIKREFSAGNPLSSRKPLDDGDRNARGAAIAIGMIAAIAFLIAAVSSLHH